MRTDEVGEIVIRPNEPSLMSDGYYGMPATSLESRRDLWFHTGDLARRDADGYFYFVGRRTDSIRRRGENISAFEVEEVVKLHPSVLDAAAFGVPSELTEDDVMVAVVVRPGHTFDAGGADRRSAPAAWAGTWCRATSTSSTTLPRTPTEKVEKVAAPRTRCHPDDVGWRQGRRVFRSRRSRRRSGRAGPQSVRVWGGRSPGRLEPAWAVGRAARRSRRAWPGSRRRPATTCRQSRRRAASCARPSPRRESSSARCTTVKMCNRLASCDSSCDRDVEVIAGVALGDEVEVALDGVVASGPIAGTASSTPIRRMNRSPASLGDLHVAAVVGVAVVVDPIRRARRARESGSARTGRCRATTRLPRSNSACSKSASVLPAAKPRLRRPCITSTRQSSRSASSSRIDRPGVCRSTWSSLCAQIVSSSSSVSSGTSISFVHGHFSAGPNWAMKWRMPASPPAMR